MEEWRGQGWHRFHSFGQGHAHMGDCFITGSQATLVSAYKTISTQFSDIPTFDIYKRTMFS